MSSRSPQPPPRPPGPHARYDRIASLLLSAAVTVIALLAGVGVLDPGAATATTQNSRDPGTAGQRLAATITAPRRSSNGGPADDPSRRSLPAATAVPADSGTGRRVVFDMSAQRVWLVGPDDSVRRSYPVSGSLTDNLGAGHYSVYSRSRHAIGVDDSGTMQYFVRFAHGKSAAIGFHDIPVKDGVPLQTRSQLGTPQSHGCIRAARPDAIALWKFAPVGTHVDVVA